MDKIKIQPHLPVWVRPPNKLVRTYDKPFDDGYGHSGIVTVKVFLDKNGKEQEVDAYIKWDKV
jgi:hypothetical protein